MYLEKITTAAEQNWTLYSKSKRLFILKNMFSGVFLTMGIIGSLSTAFSMSKVNPGLAPVAAAAVFPLALVLIIFFGGLLFTVGVFTSSAAFYDKKMTLRKVLSLWFISYIANFIAIFIIILLFCLTKSYGDGFLEFAALRIAPKLGYSIPQLLFKGMMCNFLVCLAFYGSLRIKSEAVKILVVFICIFGFVISDFEHSIANMGYLTIGYFAIPDFSFALAAKNLVFSTIGNIIGGAVLLGLPVYFLERER